MTSGQIRSAINAMRRDWLDQPALAAMEWGLLVIGTLFWIEARMSSEAFSVDIYGGFALQFPAEVWAGMMVCGSGMILIGLRDPVKRWMVAIGAAVMSLNFLGLAYSAIVTDGELIVGAFCSVLFAPLHVTMAWEAGKNGPC